MSTEYLMLGAGCFWGVEAFFNKVPGVQEAPVGYAGGHTQTPSYEAVCHHNTGHAEVVKIAFDPSVIDRGTLLKHFFSMHNPTTLNRQGPDVGDQYRSVIFYANEDEKSLAQSVIAEQQAQFTDLIVTRLKPEATFWRAEEYHQQFLTKRGQGHR